MKIMDVGTAFAFAAGVFLMIAPAFHPDVWMHGKSFTEVYQYYWRNLLFGFLLAAISRWMFIRDCRADRIK